jgi:DNA-binding transcriptional ArsR family regulator
MDKKSFVNKLKLMNGYRILERDDVRALASPLRQELLETLSTPKSAVAVAREYGMSRQRIGYHMRALQEADLIEPVEERSVRGVTEKLYRTRPMAFVLSPGHIDEGERLRDRFSWATLTNLVARALWDLVTLRRRADASGKRLATLAMEAELHFETPAQRKAFTEDLIGAFEHVVRDHERTESETSRAFQLVLGAYPRNESRGRDD